MKFKIEFETGETMTLEDSDIMELNAKMADRPMRQREMLTFVNSDKKNWMDVTSENTAWWTRMEN